MHGGKSGREYFERTANIEIGTGDEILIFASSETILIKSKKRVKRWNKEIKMQKKATSWKKSSAMLICSSSI